jgi:hypothetical protein
MAVNAGGRKSDQDRLLGALPPGGVFRTNREVRDELNLSEARYWEIRDRLVDEGKIIKSRGRGGTIALNIKSKEKVNLRDEQREEIKLVTEEIKVETALYAPFAKSIEKRAKDEGAEIQLWK